VFLLPVPDVRGQEGTYYYGPNSRPVENRNEAVLLKEVDKRSKDSYIIKTRRKTEGAWKHVSREKITIQPDGNQLIRYRAGTFFPKKILREMKKERPGVYRFRETVQDKVVRTGSSSAFLPLHLEGTVKEYHPNGEIKTIAEYKDNQLITNQNWLPDGSAYIDSVFYSVDQEPEYKMGDDFFNSYLLQNLMASKIDLSQVQDRVIIGWVVMETGELDGVIVLEGKISQLNSILVSIIRELPGSWEPALLEGSPVRYFMSIPVNFEHKGASFQELELSSGMLHYEKY
jgi:hypothetical protein